jgi:hypothetical protein
MHGRRRKNAPTSAGSVPWVYIGIVEAGALRDIHRRAVPPPCLRGRFGRNRAPGAALFRGKYVPDLIACAERFWIPELIRPSNYYLSALRF